MEFTFPQFIEKEPKIVGPLTFKQFIYVGTAGGFCIFIYFFIPFWLFVITAVLLLGWALALAFLRIGGATLPVFIKNMFIYIFRPKIYLWKKGDISPKLFSQKKEKSAVKVSEKSRLKQLFTTLQTKYKK